MQFIPFLSKMDLQTCCPIMLWRLVRPARSTCKKPGMRKCSCRPEETRKCHMQRSVKHKEQGESRFSSRLQQQQPTHAIGAKTYQGMAPESLNKSEVVHARNTKKSKCCDPLVSLANAASVTCQRATEEDSPSWALLLLATILRTHTNAAWTKKQAVHVKSQKQATKVTLLGCAAARCESTDSYKWSMKM